MDEWEWKEPVKHIGITILCFACVTLGVGLVMGTLFKWYVSICDAYNISNTGTCH